MRVRVVIWLPVLVLVCMTCAAGRGAERGLGRVTTNQPPASSTNSGSLSITTNYYRFGGTNHSQMRAAMKEARPWKQTQVFDAQTTWDVHSTFRVRREGDQFVLGSVDVRTRVVITLPWWIPGKPVPRDLVERWNKCVDGLSRHEQGHLVLARAAGAEVENRLRALPASGSPRELTAAADQTVVATIDEFRARERKYDEVTRHGVTQGAVFPMRDQEARGLQSAATPGQGGL